MNKFSALGLSLIISVNSFTAYADDDDAEDLIEYRQEVMETIKHHNKAIKMILKGKVPYNDHLGMHMNSIEASLDIVGHLFPEGSDFGETDAKDEIWDKPEKFKKTVKKAQDAFAGFKAVVAKGDLKASARAFKQFGKDACGNCHKSFKKKDD